MAASKGALIWSVLKPATKVVVFQCLRGDFPICRLAFGQRPRKRVILVLAPVSSTKTNDLLSH